MKLFISKLIIINFKGIKELIIAFNNAAPTNIYAANEVGKTTVADAWHWLLTNKNSADEKDFNIKNTVHTELNRADHIVSAIIYVDGAEVELKKVYREKWVKKRGEETAEFAGHETLYYYNEVPLTQAEFQKKIADILPETALKLITNPLYFNSIKWQERRNVLLELAGKISNDEVFDRISRLDNKQEVANLTMILNSGKTLLEYKTQITSKKKLLKTDLVAIPPRIDEVKRAIPMPVDYAGIERSIQEKQSCIANIDTAISDRNAAYQQASKATQAKQTELHTLRTSQNDLRHKLQMQLNEVSNQYRAKVTDIENNILRIKQDIQSKENLLRSRSIAKEQLTEQTDALRNRWLIVNQNELVYDEHEFTCPTCRRTFADEDIEAKKVELQQNFIDAKNKELENIRLKGESMKKEVADCDNMIETLNNALSSLHIDLEKAEHELNTIKSQQPAQTRSIDEILADNSEYVQLSTQIAVLEAESTEVKPADVSELNAQKVSLNREVDELKSQLNTKDQIERANKRVKELEAEEKSLAQQLADLERTEFLIEEFNRSKMDILEARINGKFKYVTFKMFDRQINGGEAETCETMYKGVPFSDLNTAGKVWAGLDIIATLSKHYNVFAPVFLDNRESVSNIPDVESQVINLIVSPEDKLLRVA